MENSKEKTMSIDKSIVSRRSFCIGAMAGVSLCGCRMFRRHSEYSVAVLGDTHYDAEPESVYHSNYDESNKWAKIQHAEFKRNGEMWRERCPKLIAASAELASLHKTDFILQQGDVIQGDCDHEPTHKKMLHDCIGKLRAPYPKGLPFLTVMGNHDFRGKGARTAYLDFAEPFMSAEIASVPNANHEGTPLHYPVFSFRNGDDLWVFCDFETTNLQPIIDTIECGADARHTFLVTHGPFTASDSQSFGWRLGGSAECNTLRPRLYETLSRHHAIVLSGHTHTTAYFRHESKFGSFCEYTSNAVWCRPELAKGEAVYSDPKDYGAMHLGIMTGRRLADFKAQLDIFRPGLKGYFFSDAAGHGRLDVTDDAVTMSFYPGASKKPAQKFLLKG